MTTGQTLCADEDHVMWSKALNVLRGFVNIIVTYILYSIHSIHNFQIRNTFLYNNRDKISNITVWFYESAIVLTVLCEIKWSCSKLGYHYIIAQ